MIKKQWIPLALMVCLFFPGQAQKYERESRIKTSEMPAPALAFLAESYPDRGRTRHYEEQSRRGQETALVLFYESKFKFKGSRYSVKFDSLGQLYDVERIIKFDHLPSPVKEEIRDNLGQSFQYFRIEKVQERYAPDGQLIGYEIEIQGRQDEDVGYFELQYSPKGRRQSLKSIELDSNPFFFF